MPAYRIDYKCFLQFGRTVHKIDTDFFNITHESVKTDKEADRTIRSGILVRKL